MNTAYEIVGNIAEELILENSLIDFEILKTHAVIEFLLSEHSSRTSEEKLQYKKGGESLRQIIASHA